MGTAANPPLLSLQPQHQQPGLLRLVDELCASGRAAEAHHRASLLLLSTASRLDGRAANALLRRLLRARTPLLTLRLVQAAAIVPSLPNHNRLLGLLCRAADLPPIPVLLAHRLHLRMRVAPNAASYAALLDGYARVPDPGAAQKLLDEMPQCGLVPSSLARSFLVKALLRARDVDAAMDVVHNHLWPTMAATDGHQLREDQMIDSLCRSGQHHGASRIVYIMRKRGLCPSAVSYNCIVHGLCTSPKPGACLRAHQLVMEGTSFGYRPREVTYKVLVDELCRENELAKAKDVLELMLQPTSQCRQDEGGDAGDETRTRIYNVFLGALRAVDNPSDHAEALNVLHTLMPRRRCSPTVITYNCVLKGLFGLGQVDTAMQGSSRRQRNSGTTSSGHQGLKKLAYQLVKEMKRNGLAPDAVTWRILGKLHHYEEDEQEEHQLPTADAGGSSADDRLEPLVLTKEMPLLPPLSSSVWLIITKLRPRKLDTQQK
ncbi:hypothetical protein GQ55_2G468100 [Panicum hallii var. hallii]|uniref:Pentacotripeptide-repeat region of PRORP domain-containing protein n=1 Tax=Panicum hallii var. hallii TaxID=1504633 RepID=A0A2T7EZV3_9POAL|nr:hypothetical protein GQ55_2G468100 [Panicum hallii var. hallii]PUZ73364.1 hypothetical protein GQ55_2G468100 [Panicum hallii var. hallii]